MGTEAAESCTTEGESPVPPPFLSYMVAVIFPSNTGHVKSRVNPRGPPRKAKYSSMTDSEPVLRRNGEKEPLARSERDHETVRLQAVGGT